MDRKKCTHCNEYKTLENFHKNKSSRDGYYSLCKVCKINKNKQYKKNHISEEKERNKIWFQKNKEHKLNYINNKYNSDINYKLSSVLRSRLKHAIKNSQKTGSAVRDLGISIEEFKLYLESRWQKGMNWDNWTKDGWHIDHIKPLCKFDLTNPKELNKACHYTNLQPLWAEDNLSKTNKYEE